MFTPWFKWREEARLRPERRGGERQQWHEPGSTAKGLEYFESGSSPMRYADQPGKVPTFANRGAVV